MEYASHQGEVELFLCSMVHHNLSKPSSFHIHTSYVLITMTVNFVSGKLCS